MSNVKNLARMPVEAAQSGFRADRALCVLVPRLNRRAAKALFHAGAVRLNGKPAKGNERVEAGDELAFPDPQDAAGREVLRKAAAPRLATGHGRQIARLYEDEHVLVIHKPAEIPVHRNPDGKTRRETLEDVLDRAFGPGTYFFCHRLDMETTGCLLIAKSPEARDKLIRDFEQRRIGKTYLAVCVGSPSWTRRTVRRRITYVTKKEEDLRAARRRVRAAPEMRRAPEWARRKRFGKPVRAIKMGVALDEHDEAGKPCETQFEVEARYSGYALLRCEPHTGRMHQIRVHLASEGHPLAYDTVYARRSPLRLREFDLATSETDEGERIVLNRLPLHAWKLSFTHPETEKRIEVEAPLPRDLKDFLKVLKRYRPGKKQDDNRS